ncbi:hypothetical protein PIB30_038755 [Stylosanthes scabra]|uniref:PB1-like domain-containing protein n=1 Tax=Stylosanthes scabra TaxID=79078 RepID=A0ABU6VES7_9FABA|nr:hypothetical protein [Stylosanthes scabra]
MLHMVYLTLVYHHGSNLVTKDNDSVVYEGHNIDVQDRLDEDTLDVFAVRDHHHALGYPKILDVRWLEPGREIATGLRTIGTDRDLLEMCRLARENNNKVHIYYEHVVSEPQVEEDVPQLIEMTPNFSDSGRGTNPNRNHTKEGWSKGEDCDGQNTTKVQNRAKKPTKNKCKAHPNANT